MDEIVAKKRVREDIDQAVKLGASKSDIVEFVLQEQHEEKENKKRKEMIKNLSKFREKLMAQGAKVERAFDEAIKRAEEEERQGYKK